MISKVACNDTARTVTTYDETGAVTSTRPYTAEENAAADAAAAEAAERAALDTLRADIITKAIAWLEADSAAAQNRADTIGGAIATAETQAQAYVFNGGNVSAINTQLNGGLEPLVVDMLTYIIGLGNIVRGSIR